MNDYKKITSSQLLFLIILAQIGVGIITLPYDVFMKAGVDGWISVFFAGLAIQLFIFMFGWLLGRFPTCNLYDIIQLLLGNWLGKGIIILYCIYYMCLGSIILASFAVILKSWMMPLTPKWILVLLVVGVAMYTAKEHIQVIARFCFLSFVAVIIYVGFILYALKDADITYILPVGTAGLSAIGAGIPITIYSFLGFETLLFIAPHVQSNRKELVKIATFANIFVTFFYLFVVIVTLLFFSPTELELIPEPLLYLIKSFSFNIIERPDLVFTSMWLVFVVTTVIVVFYVSSLGLSTLFNVKKRSTIHVSIVAGLCFIGSLNMYGKYEIVNMARFIYPCIFLFSIGFPAFLLLLALIRKKEGEEVS